MLAESGELLPEELRGLPPAQLDAASAERAALVPRLLRGLQAAFGGRPEDDWSLREAIDSLGAAEGVDLRAAGHKWLVKLTTRHFLLIDKRTRQSGALAGPPAVHPIRSISADVP